MNGVDAMNPMVCSPELALRSHRNVRHQHVIFVILTGTTRPQSTDLPFATRVEWAGTGLAVSSSNIGHRRGLLCVKLNSGRIRTPHFTFPTISGAWA